MPLIYIFVSIIISLTGNLNLDNIIWYRISQCILSYYYAFLKSTNIRHTFYGNSFIFYNSSNYWQLVNSGLTFVTFSVVFPIHSTVMDCNRFSNIFEKTQLPSRVKWTVWMIFKVLNLCYLNNLFSILFMRWTTAMCAHVHSIAR